MFKDEFKKLRLENNYTQEDLAKALEVSKSTISMYESGNRIPGLEMLEAIANFFNVDMNRLTTGQSNSMDQFVNNDPELTEYLEQLRTRPELRMMFQLAKGATKDDVEKAVKIIEALLSE